MFDRRAYLRTKLQKPTEAVPVPELAAWYPEGTEVVWTVRGLTGDELNRARNSSAAQKKRAAMFAALTSGTDAEMTAAARELLGMGDSISADTALEQEYVCLASVTPACDSQLAARLNKDFPDVLKRLFLAAHELTGIGSVPGKPSDSGETPESATP